MGLKNCVLIKYSEVVYVNSPGSWVCVCTLLVQKISTFWDHNALYESERRYFLYSVKKQSVTSVVTCFESYLEQYSVYSLQDKDKKEDDSNEFVSAVSWRTVSPLDCISIIL